MLRSSSNLGEKISWIVSWYFCKIKKITALNTYCFGYKKLAVN